MYLKRKKCHKVKKNTNKEKKRIEISRDITI